MKRKFSFTLFVALIPLTIPGYASLLLGTKDLDYSFLIKQDLQGKLYKLSDIAGNPLEEGFRLRENRGNNSWFSFKLSQLHKDNLLERAILSKLYWTAAHPLKIGQLDSRFALGCLYFPSMFSAWTNYEAAPTTALSLFTSQILSAKFKEINWRLGVRLNFSSDVYGGNPSYDMLSLSHLDGLWGADYYKDLPLGFKGLLSFTGLVRTSSFFPIDLFQNQELGAGIENKSLSLKYYYPLKFEYKRQNYPFQGKRVEMELHSPSPFETGFDMSLVIPPEGPVLYRAMISKNIKGVIASVFASENYQNKQLGSQISFDEDSFQALDNYYISKDHVPTASQAKVNYPFSTITPDEVAVANLDQLIPAVKTPADACWYVTHYLNYASDHNGLAEGLFKIYTPQEVFGLKKGNCTEQASLQKYLLEKQGYETAILSSLARTFFHSILAYKDPATGKWNAIDNSGELNVYICQADTYEELVTGVFPGWISLVVKGDNAKGIYQVDSSSKWYVEDWLENE